MLQHSGQSKRSAPQADAADSDDQGALCVGSAHDPAGAHAGVDGKLDVERFPR